VVPDPLESPSLLSTATWIRVSVSGTITPKAGAPVRRRCVLLMSVHGQVRSGVIRPFSSRSTREGEGEQRVLVAAPKLLCLEQGLPVGEGDRPVTSRSLELQVTYPQGGRGHARPSRSPGYSAAPRRAASAGHRRLPVCSTVPALHTPPPPRTDGSVRRCEGPFRCASLTRGEGDASARPPGPRPLLRPAISRGPQQDGDPVGHCSASSLCL